MHVLRFFLTLRSVSDLGRAQARRRIRVFTQCPRPLFRSSADLFQLSAAPHLLLIRLFRAYPQSSCDPSCR